MNIDELEDWSERVLHKLQDFCDEAQETAGNPEGESELRDVRALMVEYELIAAGKSTWQAKVLNSNDGELSCLLNQI